MIEIPASADQNMHGKQVRSRDQDEMGGKRKEHAGAEDR